MLEKTSLQLMRTSSNGIWRGNMGTHHPSKEQASSRTNKDGKEYVVIEKTKVTDVIRTNQEAEVDLGRACQQDKRKPMDIAYYQQEIQRKENTYMKTGELVERRTRRLLDGYHLAEDSAREAV